MGIYHFNEGALDIPDAWTDQTINIFSATAGGKPGASFVVTRDARGKHDNAASYVKAQMKKLADELDTFKLIREINTTVDDVPSVVVEFSWKSHTGLVRQIQAHLIIKDKALSYTYTVPENMMNKDVYNQFQALINSTRLRNK